MLKVRIEEIKLKILEDRTVLSGIDFTLKQNQVFTIAGKNGSGKSTLLKAIPRLLDERFFSVSGSVEIFGKDLYKISEPELLQLRRSTIKYVMQDSINSFDPLRTFRYYFENIFPDKSPDMKETENLLKYFLLPAADKLFALYPYEVSGGMAQRISFVLALLAHPQIILLDEPTSGIDTPVVNLFLHKLREFASLENNCAILVTHDLKFAKKAGDIFALLSGGKLTVFASSEELLSYYNKSINSFSDAAL